MKRTFYTMLLATALSIPAGHATAESLGSALSGQVGVSTPITGNTNVQTNTQTSTGMDSNMDGRARTNFRSDSNERTMREQNQMDGRTQTMTESSSTSMQSSIYSTNDLDRDTVRNIQRTLNDRGYNVGAIDGRWGNVTASQLRRFEQNQGLEASSGRNVNAQSLQQLGVNFDTGTRMNTIDPAAGDSYMPPSVDTGVTGSTSYNQ